MLKMMISQDGASACVSWLSIRAPHEIAASSETTPARGEAFLYCIYMPEIDRSFSDCRSSYVEPRLTPMESEWSVLHC